LRGADLDGADLFDPDLRGANLDGADLDGANLMNLSYPKNEMEHCAMSEIDSLRQQVSQAEVDMVEFKKLYETLALRDLEIVKLREALEYIDSEAHKETK